MKWFVVVLCVEKLAEFNGMWDDDEHAINNCDSQNLSILLAWNQNLINIQIYSDREHLCIPALLTPGTNKVGQTKAK